MHEPDLNLLDEAKYKLANSREKSTTGLFAVDETLNQLITQYEIAIELSNGIDQSRSAYWSQKARERRNKLKEYLNRKEVCVGR